MFNEINISFLLILEFKTEILLIIEEDTCASNFFKGRNLNKKINSNFLMIKL